MKQLKPFVRENKWFILALLALLALVPVDPTDIIDAGTPIAEIIAAVATLVVAQ